MPAVPSSTAEEKTEIQIQSEIQAIFRQITASVTFLPELDGSCTFNVLVYADANSEVPLEWGDSDAKEIEGGERVQLRSFSTSSHRVDTLVSYRYVHKHVSIGAKKRLLTTPLFKACRMIAIRIWLCIRGWVLDIAAASSVHRINSKSQTRWWLTKTSVVGSYPVPATTLCATGLYCEKSSFE